MIQNSVDSVEDVGNTKTSSLVKKKQINACSNWVFTYNNYTNDDIVLIVNTFDSLGKYVFQREIGESGTPHLQGCLKLNKRARPTSFNLPKQIHWEPCRSWNHSVKYCSKIESRVGETQPYTNLRLPREIVKMTYAMLREDQKQIADMFMDPEDSLFGRKIHWFWESTGGWGKSILTKYFIDSHKLSCMTIANKTADAFFQIAKYVEENGEGPDVIICDIPRSSLEYINYQAMEKIKDGCFSSGKYECCEVRINSPHIICFANEPPDTSKLSKDRWVVRLCDKN